jgi:hypothetical protein
MVRVAKDPAKAIENIYQKIKEIMSDKFSVNYIQGDCVAYVYDIHSNRVGRISVSDTYEIYMYGELELFMRYATLLEADGLEVIIYY